MRTDMMILRLTHVFIILRLVTGISDVTTELLDIPMNMNSSEANAYEQIMKSNIKMNDVTERDDYDNTTDLNWDVNRAIRDLAYYLRAHKFVDYDHRYYDKLDDVKHGLWEEFPKPPLRSLHWEVHKYCDNGFINCLKYLDSIVQQTLLKREDDTIVVMRNNKWTSRNNMLQIINANRECEAARERDNLTYVPFQGPIERFQWRTTASYYMCWYTMLGRPELFSFNEPCDDFADCLTIYGNTRDPRAHDSEPFACALYSFCPDPCCTMKIIWFMEDCYRSPMNPCYKPNSTEIQTCTLNRVDNQDFYGLMANQINFTCKCNEQGYEWSSRFGLCVDINECTRDLHNCSTMAGEICINLPGDFECLCQHDFIYSDEMDRCVENLLFKQIVVKTIQEYTNVTERTNVLDNIVKLLTKSFANKCNYYFSTFLLLIIFYLITL